MSTRKGEPIIRLSNKHESGAVSEALRVYELAEDRGTMKVITYSVFPELDPPRATYDVMVFTASLLSVLPALFYFYSRHYSQAPQAARGLFVCARLCVAPHCGGAKPCSRRTTHEYRYRTGRAPWPQSR